MKIELELNSLSDGRKYLNFRDYLSGEDLVVEVVEGRLYLNTPLMLDPESATPIYQREITLKEFISMVEERTHW